MSTNFWWLFAAYTIVWAVLFAYVAAMAAKMRRLQREVDGLKARR